MRRKVENIDISLAIALASYLAWASVLAQSTNSLLRAESVPATVMIDADADKGSIGVATKR
jgi:hypothetical protein